VLTGKLGAAALGALSVGCLAGCGSIVISSGPGPTTTFIPGPSVTIGVLAPLTGSNSAVGQAERNGAELAITQYESGTEQVTAHLAVMNTGGSAARAVADAKAMIKAGVVAVVGPGTDAEATAVDPVLARAGIPQIVVSATADSLSDRGDAGFHRVAASDSEAGADLAQYLINQGVTTAAVVDDGLSDDTTLLGQLDQTLANDTITTTQIIFPDSNTTAGLTASTIVDGTTVPDAVVFVGDATDGGALAVSLRDDGYTGTVLLGGAAGDPESTATQAWLPQSVGVTADLASAGDDPGSSATLALTFQSAYFGAYGKAPPEWSAQAYDATNAVLKTLGPAATGTGAGVVPGATITPAAVETALNTLSFAGASGTISFDPDTGDLASPPVWISQVKDGTVTQQSGDITSSAGDTDG
jgi:branched-chain amino acid transport system substrate-binding protein